MKDPAPLIDRSLALARQVLARQVLARQVLARQVLSTRRPQLYTRL